MKRVSFEDMSCSIARSLEVVGEWWTPLILRQAFLGRTRFDQLQADLGISRNILTDRLTKLVDAEILAKRNIAQTGERFEYRLTEKGRELFPVLMALMEWGDKWEAPPAGPPTVLTHVDCGHDMHPTLTCDHCQGVVTLRNTKARPAEAYLDDPAHPLAHAARPA